VTTAATRRTLLALLAAGALVTLLLAVRGRPAPAATLVSESPDDGGRVGTAPAAVTLTFSGPVDRSLSHLSVTAAGSPAASVADGSFSVDGDQLRQPVAIKADGGYQVAYHAVLTNGQEVSGAVGFGVNDAAPPPDPTAATGHEHVVDFNPENLALLAVDALLIVVVLVLMLRGPRLRTGAAGAAGRWTRPSDL
jgi:methionine-rich copper-binding protein CopC